MLIAAGILLAALGAPVVWGAGVKWLRLGRLPGDFSFHRDGFSFYFPLTTLLLVSAVLSAVLCVVSSIRR